MKDQRGSRGNTSTLSLTSALLGVGSQRHALAALTQVKRPCTHCIGGWVVPRAGLDGCEKSRTHQDSIPGLPARSESPYGLSYPGTQTNQLKKFCYYF